MMESLHDLLMAEPLTQAIKSTVKVLSGAMAFRNFEKLSRVANCVSLWLCSDRNAIGSRAMLVTPWPCDGVDKHSCVMMDLQRHSSAEARVNSTSQNI